ncbi:MAG: gluconate 2-dehydrogenase subunit 3 family protein [Burkholderiales bacterium]|nr:gluconate 2-dehydrogenase subunit 3 family protein [Burkholderiales bacterium]
MEATKTASMGYVFLTAPEVRFLEAAIERLIPADELGAGAKEAGVAYYIDRQLGGAWGVHGRSYRAGPWYEGSPQQGFQSRLTPQEIYRTAIREIDERCRTKFGRQFDQLPPETQDEILSAMERGEFDLPSLSSRLFFELLWRNTEEGFFSDPLYGGNHDKAGWKLLGFPGVPSGAYREHVGRSERYRVEPVSILDIATKRAKTDAQGMAVHVQLKREED